MIAKPALSLFPASLMLIFLLAPRSYGIGVLPVEGFADMVERVSPAVVYIEEGDYQESFSGKNTENAEIPFLSDESSPRHGSGFLISAEGHILTNKHVIEDLDSVIVTLNDNREYKAKIVKIDPHEDLALLKIRGDNFHSLQFANPQFIRPGDWAIAIGCPFKSGPVVTSGIVSSTGKTSSTSKFYTHYIQTDASITAGNSGGPLLNTDGEVIGINSAMLSKHGAHSGLGFALAIHVVLKSQTLMEYKNLLK